MYRRYGVCVCVRAQLPPAPYFHYVTVFHVAGNEEGWGGGGVRGGAPAWALAMRAYAFARSCATSQRGFRRNRREASGEADRVKPAGSEEQAILALRMWSARLEVCAVTAADLDGLLALCDALVEFVHPKVGCCHVVQVDDRRWIER
jgi:hypothetical protein